MSDVAESMERDKAVDNLTKHVSKVYFSSISASHMRY